jgi:hypothetical protein
VSESQRRGAANSNLRAEAPEFVPRLRVGPRKLTVKVDGMPIKFLCDTGAESTVLSLRCFESMSKQARQKFQDCSSAITMPDGREKVSKGPV